MEREKIKNALSKTDLKTLLKIVKCYNTDNGLTQIYENSSESVKELKDCGYTVDELKIQDFAFLTPNRYGGVSGQNDLGIDFETELVPYIEANYTTYANDLHIEDDRTIFDVEWLKSNWTKAIGHENRYLNLLRIADKVDKEDKELSSELYKIASKYDSEPKRYTYNWAKEEFFNLFQKNVPDKGQEISELEKKAMKEEAEEAYNNTYNKKVDKFNNLPKSWQEILAPLIESGRKESFKKELAKLKGETGTSKETVEDLKRDFERVYGFRATEGNIKNFGDKEEENGQIMLEAFKATFEAFKKGEIGYDRAVRFFENVKAYPSKYLMLCENWYKPPMSEEEEKMQKFNKRQREIEGDLENKTSQDEKANKLKEELEKNMAILKSSQKEEWIQHWEEDLDINKELYEEGKFTLIQYLENLTYALDYCLLKAGLKNKSYEQAKKQNKKDEEKENEVINSLNSNDNFKLALAHFEHDKTLRECNLLIDKLHKAIKSNSLSYIDIEDMTDDQIYKFFETIVSNDKKSEQFKNMLEAIKKESD